MHRLRAVAAAGLIFVSLATNPARADEARTVKFGAFLDTYYAYDFKKPGAERIFIAPSGGPPALYSTQPSRHNEFNLNLAFIEAKLDAERVRGRLALQMGTSVQANYAAETSADQNRAGAGAGISRYIQEAVAGYQITPDLWVDAGIYFSHIGMESFISRDNWTYTRSLSAENSPYYQSGVRLSYAISKEWSAQLHLLNGWQNINENNKQKSVGTQVAYAPSDAFSITYNTLIGSEGGSRIFQDLIVKYAFGPNFQLGGSFDYGIQRAAGNSNKWWVGTLIARYQATEKVALVARAERFSDPNSAIVSAGSEGFRVWGGSIGVDTALQPNLVWRNELRLFGSAASIFPSKGGTASQDSFAVTSLALTI